MASWPLAQIPIGITSVNDLLKNVDAVLARLQGQGPEPDIERLRVIRDKLAGLQGSVLDVESIKVMEAVLDLSLAKIAYLVGMQTALIRQAGKKKEGMVKVNIGRRLKPERILQAFSKVRKEKWDTLNTIVARIYNLLGKPKTPSEKGITRILKENKELMKCVSKEIWGKSNRYIFELDTRASV